MNDPIYCECCGFPLKPEKVIWLAFHMYRAKYYRQEDAAKEGWLDTEDDQGLFPFGSSCAPKVLEEQD